MKESFGMWIKLAHAEVDSYVPEQQGKPGDAAHQGESKKEKMARLAKEMQEQQQQNRPNAVMAILGPAIGTMSGLVKTAFQKENMTNTLLGLNALLHVVLIWVLLKIANKL